MKPIGLLIVGVMTWSACGGGSSVTRESPATAASDEPAGVTPVWTVTDGMETPESAYFDPASGFIFVSQIAGAFDGRDGNGRIVKLDRGGAVVSTSWVTGLNAPKGLRACQGTLWTADLDDVVGVDVASGRVTARVKIAGAQFLNDVACDTGGTVYVSDMMANRIYAVKNGKADVFAEGAQLEFPNGLLVEGDRLIVAGWGSQPKADFTTDVPGHLFALNLQTKAKTLITRMPVGNLDGVESDGRGGYVVSDYIAGRLFQVSSTGESREIGRFGAGAADIGVVPDADLVVVPHMNDNKVAAYPIARATAGR